MLVEPEVSKQQPRSVSAYSDEAIAAAYDRLLVPYHLAAPAKDLVAMLGLPAGGRVLDVGSGTGAAAIAAADMVGTEGMVVALEPSIEMLRLLRRKRVCRTAAGLAPGLPFPADRFDAVLANFVLSHFQNYRAALEDMVRVLRRGGSLGLTAWGPGQTEFMRVWKEVAGAFVGADRLQQASREVVPWEEWFRDAMHLQQALKDAGLVGVEVTQQEYRVTISVMDYLSLREAALEGRLLTRELGPEQWRAFRQRVIAAFRDRFREPLEYTREIHLALGRKPSSLAS